MDILMPQLGETVAVGTVTKWYKQVGDSVTADEPLFDLETDKVATEIPAQVTGVITEIRVAAGTSVKVGTCVAVIRGEKEKAAAPAAAAATPTLHTTSQPATDGSDRHSRAGGSPGASPDSRVHGSDGAGSTANASLATARVPQQKLSPVVRRLLAEHGIAAGDVRGTGRDGRVMRDDVLDHVKRKQQPASTAPPPSQVRPAIAVPASTPTAAAPQALAGTGDVIVPLNNIRRRSAAAMARAWQTVPHVLQAVEADYSRIQTARRDKGDAWRKREGYALTYLPFLAWAVSQALLRYEQLNARIDGDNLIVSRRVQLGVAVDLDHDGLVVPVIRDAQDRSVAGLAREISRLASGARSNKLAPNDYGIPTYTISNSGVFGTLITAPIVNPPQVAILSTDGVSKRPVVVESEAGDSIAIRPVGVLAQSFDHRAIDGAYSAAFLKELKRIIETRDWTEDL